MKNQRFTQFFFTAAAALLLSSFSATNTSHAAEPSTQEIPISWQTPEQLQSSMPSDCYCSAEKQRSCESQRMSCCANWSKEDGCRIYCGTACIAPW